jgi:hypothetical protein
MLLQNEQVWKYYKRTTISEKIDTKHYILQREDFL